jgi:toxoflavin synthase
MSEFDDLGELYEQTFELPWRRHLEVPTVLDLLGNLTDHAVLDIGSGSGWYCRTLAQHGAREVVGLDVSNGMLDYARQHNSHPKVEYLLDPLPDELHGHFDTALTVYVFGYAKTREQLNDLCRTAAASLRPTGRFLVLTLNPDYQDDPEYYASYGFRLTSSHPKSDGAPATLDLQFGEHSATLAITYWSRETLAAALHSAGFSDITYHDHQLSPEGIKKEGMEYWKDYLDRPHVAILDCRLSDT